MGRILQLLGIQIQLQRCFTTELVFEFSRQRGEHEKDKTQHTQVYMTHTRTHRRWTGIASHIKVTYFYMLLWLCKKGNWCSSEKSSQIRMHKDLCVTRCRDEIPFAKLYDIATHLETLASSAARSFSAWQQAHFSFAVCEPPLDNYGKTNWESGLLWWLMLWHRQIS